MAKTKRTDKQSATNREAICNEILLMMNIADIETKMAADTDDCRFAQLADAYLAAGGIDEAIRLCELGRKKFPHYGTAALVLSDAYRQKGDRQNALSVLREFLNEHPASLTAHKMMGDIALEEGNIRKSVKHFRVALRLDPVNRDLIQRFVEVRDEFQKVKDSLPAEEDESDDAKPVIAKSAMPEKTIERVLDEVLEMPDSFKESALDSREKKSLMEEHSAEPFTMESEPLAEKPEPAVTESDFRGEPDEEKIITKETQNILPDDEDEPVIQKTVKPAAGDMNPVFVDEKGVMYFYDDDEVSFDQYKKRFDLQKLGKAKIMNRARLDERLALIGIASSAKTELTDNERLARSVDHALAQFTPEPVRETETLTESGVSTEEASVETGEESAVLQSAGQAEEFEEEAAFEDIEMSYKDYLDILTEEEDLLEALMGEGPQEPVTEEIAADLVTKLIGAPVGEEFRPAAMEEKPVSYGAYLSSLTDTCDIDAAKFTETPAPDAEEEQRIMSLAEFAEELDFQDELIDFQTYRLFSPEESLDEFFGQKEEPAESAEPAISYGDFLDSLQSEEYRREARLDEMTEETITASEPAAETEAAPAVESVAEITEPEILPETFQPAEPVIEPVREEMTAAVIETPPETAAITEREEVSHRETLAIAERKEEPLRKTAAAETVAEEETEEPEEEFDIEAEIDLRKASLELVDQLAQFGQFGAAYKVCKMLKLKNPTDAKVDRKILELKRLYLWSSQLVG